MTKKADEKTTGKGEKDKNINSKGYRRNFKNGVVGWQEYLEQLRNAVNVYQYGSALGMAPADKKTVLAKIEKESQAVEKQHSVKVPARLFGRRELARNDKFTSEAIGTSDWSKNVRKLILQIDRADDAMKAIIKNTLVKVKSDAEKSDARLSSKVRNLINELT